MLCGCVPVGTRVGGIPTAVGEHGFLVEYGDIDALATALEDALAQPDIAGSKARQYITKNFTLEKRDSELKTHPE
jgi:glycosyltransferase involved in cell wall biosynthesis